VNKIVVESPGENGHVGNRAIAHDGTVNLDVLSFAFRGVKHVTLQMTWAINFDNNGACSSQYRGIGWVA
jgi:hypothetical protein